jgi:signal transduction histidine kinase
VKITTRLTLVFVLFAFCIISFIGFLAYTNGRESLLFAIQSELMAQSLDKEAAINDWIESHLTRVVALSKTPSLVNEIATLVTATRSTPEGESAYERILRDLEPRVEVEKSFQALLIVDAHTAKVLAADPQSEEGNFKEDIAWYVNGKNGPYVQNVYYSMGDQGISMTVAAPVLNNDNQLIAVLGGQLNLDELNEIVNRRTGLYITEEAFLVNSSNLFVTQPRLVDNPAVLQMGVHTQAVEKCLAQSSGFIEAPDYRDKMSLISYRWLSERNLCLIVKLHHEEAFASIQDFGVIILLTGVATLIVASALAFVLARSITEPIVRLQRGVARLRDGELGVRVPEASKDEFGILASEFNQMASTIAEKESQLKQRAEQLETVNKELEAFTYSVSHDLRAPLRHISGFVELLFSNAQDLDAKNKHYLETIANAAKKMGILIDELLQFSRVGRTEVNKTGFHLKDMVEEIRKELIFEVSDRNIEWEVGSLTEVHADRILLKSVLSNLISNAVKFTSKRDHAKIEIDADRSNGQEVVFHIHDNGVGFDMKYSDKLFGLFQRLHRSDEFEGTGVGLANVRRIIHRHGGRTWAEGELDRGATFYFSIPIPPKEKNGEHPQTDSAG